jgi:Protein of unknown function (DUF3562)
MGYRSRFHDHRGDQGMTPRPRTGSPTVPDPLPGLRKQLAKEYGGRVPPETIDQVARQALGELREARIHDYVPVLAWRRARGRLGRAS